MSVFDRIDEKSKGIAKKNKRLWITSLIFLVITILAECAYFITV